MMLPVADTPRVPNARVRQQAPAAPSHVNETPQGNSFGPDLTWTQVLGDKEAADKFAEDNIGRRQQRPKVSSRDNAHAYRDSWNATHRSDDPLKTESFTRAAPECHARLDGPLTLEGYIAGKEAIESGSMPPRSVLSEADKAATVLKLGRLVQE